MSRTGFTVLMVAIVVIAFVAMWIAWRARARRDSAVAGSAASLVGEALARFDRLQYVSTTVAGEPMTRVAAPGLRYRGPAELVVHRDGVQIEIAGEAPVRLSAGQIAGGAVAGHRAGKAVEANGLALLRWRSDADPRELESSFRFVLAEEQRRFLAAIDEIAAAAPQNSVHTTQEDS